MTGGVDVHRPESWGSKASDYDDQFLPFSDGVARAALDRLELSDGSRFLDVAAGTGALALAAARGGADVTAVDFSPGMLARLERRLTTDGQDRVTTHVMDGEHLDLDDDTFDAAGSNLGLVFFADPVAGLAELRRVVRPGGRIVITSVEASPSQLMQFVMGAIANAVPDFRPAAPAAFQLADHDSLSAALAQAGLSDAVVETVSVPFPVADPAAFWNSWALDAPPVAAMMSGLDDDARHAARDVFVRLVSDVESAGGVRSFATDVLVGSATV